jgi:alpha-galactosidase
MKRLLLALFLAGSLLTDAQKFENLAPTPPMGWNSWNTFQTKINEQMVMQMADVMVSSGMKDAGYNYLVLDDGWMAKERDKTTGDLVPDPAKFPHGMKVVADYVHSKGLKFGLYNCAGTKTCAGYPGTRGYEYQDARFYASLGIDYLKFDWCNTEGINAKEVYTTMSKALRTAGRPIVFSLCEWGSNKPWEWAAPVGQLWRTTGDIFQQFDSVHKIDNWTALSVMKITDLQEPLRAYAGPNHWNDPDMLEVGNGMTALEDKTHFSLWAMLAAPLMAGNDLRNMSQQTKGILTNKEVIAVDQDPKGVEGYRYARHDSLEVYVRPLANNEWALCFVNRSSRPKTFDFDWNSELIDDTLSKQQLNARQQNYSVRDLWLKKEVGNTKKPFRGSLAPHDAVMVRLTPQKV